MFVQKYFVGKEMRNILIETVKAIDEEFNETVLRYACGLYYGEDRPQEVTVVGLDEKYVNYLNDKIWS